MWQKTIFILLLLVLIESSDSDPSWILKQTKQITSELLQFHAIDNNSLLMQTQDSIYIAPSGNPSAVQQGLISQLNQRIPAAFDQQSSTYLYIDFQYLQYGQPNSSQKHTLQNATYSVNIVKIKDVIYYIQPDICSYLMLYNLTSKENFIGPYLTHAAFIKQGSSISTNSQQTQIRIAIEGMLFIISVETLKVLQVFYNQPTVAVELIDVASPKFFVQNTEPFKKIFKYDQMTNKTTLVYTVLINGFSLSRFGYVCDEETDTCKQIQIYPSEKSIYIRVTEMDCSEPYDKVVAQLEDAVIHIHTVGDDKISIYSLNQSNEQYWLIKNDIRDNSFVKTFNKSLPVQFDIEDIKVFKVGKQEIVVLRDSRLVIVDLQRNIEICKDQIAEHKELNEVNQVFFNNQGNEIFLTTQANKQKIYWITIKTCEVHTIEFDLEIFSVLFWDTKILVFFASFEDDLYELDPKTKDIVNKTTSPANNCIIFKGNMYGFLPGIYIYSIVKINASLAIVASKQLSCRSATRQLQAGTDHLSVVCNNQYYIFDENLSYLGTTIIQHQELQSENIQQTASPLLRFDRFHGYLHLGVLKKWNNSYSKHSNNPMIMSHLYFKNKTDAVYISKGSQQLFLNYVSLEGSKFRYRFGIGMSIYGNDSFTMTPFFRWSTDKSYILFRYISRSDQFQLYQNVYDFPSFKLAYSHRVGTGQISPNLISFMGQDKTLIITHHKQLVLVDLQRRKSAPFSDMNTGQLSFSANGEYLLAIGQNAKKQQQIGVICKNTGEIIQKYKVFKYKRGSKLYAIEKKLFVLSNDSLYNHQAEQSTLVQDNIADCTYLNKQSIICLKNNNQFLVINQTHSLLMQTLYSTTYQKIKANEKFILAYNTHSFAIFTTEPPFRLIQVINLNQRRADLASLSSNSEAITYDRQNKSLSYWRRGQCPSLTQLNEGVCECIEDQIDGVCACRKGRFESEGKCLDCSFYCSECSGNAGGCQTLSAGGVFMILGLALLPFAAGAGICCYLRRRKARLSKMQVMSELLEQHSNSINDD